MLEDDELIEITMEIILPDKAIDKINTLTWPPPYNLRRSMKARQTFLQITKTKGLEIVVPARQKNINIEQLLNEKRRWIEKTLWQIIQTSVSTPAPIEPLPNMLYLQTLEESWNVFYQYYPLKRVKLTMEPSHKMLWLKGNTTDLESCKKVLRKWLSKIAKQRLIPWLYALSLETSLIYTSAIIRGQNTLWGSCNFKKNISLNYKLLFLPKALTQHVLLHELCHTKYLNHSARFWALLNKFDIHLYENKRMLKTAEGYVPAWV